MFHLFRVHAIGALAGWQCAFLLGKAVATVYGGTFPWWAVLSPLWVLLFLCTVAWLAVLGVVRWLS